MKNKGFTLIELLAVIVILAIIALIATPIILGIINDARTQARKRSAELVYTGVQYAYTTAMYSGTEGTSVGTVTLTAIKDNLNIENLKTGADAPAIDTTATPNKLVIKTNDGVTCNVTEEGTNTGIFKVECGDDLAAKYIASN